MCTVSPCLLIHSLVLLVGAANMATLLEVFRKVFLEEYWTLRAVGTSHWSILTFFFMFPSCIQLDQNGTA